MERSDTEKSASEDGNQLNRNRSFKSKQLVRSQAIRESQSPPRTASPSSPAPVDVINNVAVINVAVKNNVTVIGDRTCEDSGSDDVSEVTSENKDCGDEVKKQPVEIQITGGGWDEASEQRQRTRRWLGHRHYSDSSRDLLSNNPRVACVCGTCANCPHCRGRRRRHICPIKQDSGIACSDDCPDCNDSDFTGGHTDSLRKSESVEMEEQIYYCRCPERKERPKNASLSRTDSDERTEPTGPELVNFLKDTLNKNARDRVTLLKIEKELHALINDTGRCIVRFPVMTSYGRMLVHRCAALFQLSHHLDQSNKSSVTVSKSGTSGGRIPCTNFKQWCTANFPPSPQRLPPDITHAKSILKRDTHSLDEPGNGSLANSRSKSLEQREKDYERMKRRIFSSDNCAQDESQWPWLAGGPVKLLTPETGRNKLLKVQSLEGSGPTAPGRGPVSKSHSFGGYAASEPPHPRLLSRQGDLASSSWRLSPSSSGYKTLSLRSTDSVTPSPTGGASPEPPVPAPACAAGAVVWCVTDMAAVPPGALLIHPQTGRPLSNPDGSVYRFDPANPPTVYEQGYEETDNMIDQNEKKRGKLEKQHSFMDHGECECQPSEGNPNKYCGECRRHDTDKNLPAHEDQIPQIPQSPLKNRYEQPENITDTKRTYESPAVPKPEVQRQTFEPTNRAYIQTTNENNVPYEASHYASERYEVPANQRPPFEQSNQGAEQRVKLTNQDSQEMQYNQYGHGIRPEEVTSPAVQNPYAHADTHTMHPKGPPVIPEHNLRQMSVTNMIYPGVPHGYPYMNQCRMEQLQPMYAPAAPPGEEHKQLAPSPHQEPTFRIDPSYPYAAAEYAAQCGACVDPNAINALRSYNLSYGQVELPQPYQLQNVLVPQPQLQYYPYQESVQWPPQPLMPLGGKLLMPEPCHMYGKPVAQYGLIYPQVIPQHYPICQPLYPVVEKPCRRDSLGSRHSANTPRPEDAHTNVPNNMDKAQSRRNSNEIAIKIQQIKEQMAALDTGNGSRRARNSGHGILGSYPQPTRGTSNDETQLSSAARAIVNSIRNMQAKSTYQDNRRDYNHYRPDRPDFRPRRPERQPDNRFPDKEKTEAEMQFRDRRPPPFQGRPPQPHRQMSPGTWCRRSPGPVHPFLNHPRRPHPDNRNGRR